MSAHLQTVLDQILEERGGVAGIHLAFKDFSEGVSAHYEFYKRIMLADGLPLNRVYREYLAMITSQANRCAYCISHHSEAFQNQSENIPQGQIDLLNEFSEILSRDAQRAYEFKDKFLSQSFTAAQWQHAVMIVSYFNFANRLAFAMDLELEPSFHVTCR